MLPKNSLPNILLPNCFVRLQFLKSQLKSLILNQTFYRLPNKLKFMIKIRDCQQITLITLNTFCLLSEKAPITLFIKDNIKLDEICEAKLNEKYMSVLQGISSFERTS